MATAFIAVAGQHGVNAEQFYRMFPGESVLPNPQVLQIQRVNRLARPSLNALLRAIARARQREIVVVSHGAPTQLAIPVMRGINVGLDRNFVTAILSQQSDAQLATRLRTRRRNVTTLRRRIRAVHALNLQRVEFRACRVGANRQTLQALKQLFGAASACAPTVFDGYGAISGLRPTTNAAALAAWQQANQNHQTHGNAPDRFFWVTRGSSDPPTISHAFAESWAAVRAWAQAKFPSGGNNRYRSGTVRYHGQATMAANSSQVHGQRTFLNRFAFPTDAAYRQNLVRIP